MFRFNDIFLVIVACYVIYKIGFVDGFTLVNLFIAVCTVVAFVSTILRRSGYMERLKEKENEAVKKREEKKIYPNDPCPCGSGKKYKQCCGRKQAGRA